MPRPESQNVKPDPVLRKSIRVVYRIVEDEVIVEIVGIGKRADFEVYADVARRLLRKE